MPIVISPNSPILRTAVTDTLNSMDGMGERHREAPGGDEGREDRRGRRGGGEEEGDQGVA